jgi:uncharacterized protein YozE (UPF0346 family)
MARQDLSSFTHWLRAQTERPDPVGVLARHAAADSRWPLSPKTLASYARYLEQHAASEEVIAGLFDAWSEYEAERDIRHG